MSVDPSRFRQPGRSTEAELGYREQMEAYAQESPGTWVEKLEAFPKFVSRQTTARMLALHETFRLALPVQGDVIECGVSYGGALMWFAQLSATLEPVNLQRRIIGFDTFAGFTPPTDEDRGATPSRELRAGGFFADTYDDLRAAVALYDANRFLGHVPKVHLVKGDASETIPRYLVDNPHTVVSLLHLDFDLYEPTVAALRAFVPRMPKGAVIVFDELNNTTWPGETRAVIDEVGLNGLAIRRFAYEPHVSYAVLS